MLARRIYLTLVILGASSLVGCGAYQRPAVVEGGAAGFDTGALFSDLSLALGTAKEVAIDLAAAKASGEAPDFFGLGGKILAAIFGTSLVGGGAMMLKNSPAKGEKVTSAETA